MPLDQAEMSCQLPGVLCWWLSCYAVSIEAPSNLAAKWADRHSGGG